MVSRLTTRHDNINLIRLMIYDLETRTHDIPSFLFRFSRWNTYLIIPTYLRKNSINQKIQVLVKDYE